MSAIIVAVDLLPLRPGGENGGIKPAIFSLLGEVGRRCEDSLVFLFITNSASHSQVREVARTTDILLCVMEEPAHPLPKPPLHGRSEFVLSPPPSGLLETLAVDLLYCPFGATHLRAPGIPIVAMIADLLHRDYPLSLTPEQISERESYIAETIQSADQIQCISRSGMERLLFYYKRKRSSLFYTYLPIQLRLEASASPLPFPNPGEDRPFFFYPANLWPHKNHEVLLLAYSIYVHTAKAQPWDLVLTFQEMPHAGELRALAASLGISKQVRFAGYLSESELHRTWQRAGALIFPSLHEGFGIPLVEAMHYGVPIISSWEFSLKEIAADACYRIDPRKPTSIANALREISTNQELRETLAARGRTRLRLFDFDVTVGRLIETFQSMIRANPAFPRKTNFLDHERMLTMQTPACRDIWRIEVEMECDDRYSVYLEDAPFGSFAPPFTENRYSFHCRPQGRLLGILPESTAPTDPVKQVVAINSQEERVILYQGSNTYED